EAQEKTTSDALGSAQSHNVVSSAFLNNASAAPPLSSSGSITGDVGGFVTALINEMSTIQSSSSSGFQNALDDLLQAIQQISDPVQALRQALAAFAELIGA